MRIEPQDQAVLDHVAAQGDAIVQRAVDWSNINSGSRHAEGLARILDVLDATARAAFAQATVERVPTQGSTTVADSGAVIAESYADCLKIVARPEAPLQVVLTGHYDTVFPADSAFQRVVTATTAP